MEYGGIVDSGRIKLDDKYTNDLIISEKLYRIKNIHQSSSGWLVRKTM